MKRFLCWLGIHEWNDAVTVIWGIDKAETVSKTELDSDEVEIFVVVHGCKHCPEEIQRRLFRTGCGWKNWDTPVIPHFFS